MPYDCCPRCRADRSACCRARCCARQHREWIHHPATTPPSRLFNSLCVPHSFPTRRSSPATRGGGVQDASAKAPPGDPESPEAWGGDDIYFGPLSILILFACVRMHSHAFACIRMHSHRTLYLLRYTLQFISDEQIKMMLDNFDYDYLEDTNFQLQVKSSETSSHPIPLRYDFPASYVYS